MNVPWVGHIGSVLLPAEKIRNFGEKSPQNQGRDPTCGGLECMLGPPGAIVQNQNYPPNPLGGGDIRGQSFRFPPKFPQIGGSEGGQGGTVGNYSGRATNVPSFAAKRRKFFGEKSFHTWSPIAQGRNIICVRKEELGLEIHTP